MAVLCPRTSSGRFHQQNEIMINITMLYHDKIRDIMRQIMTFELGD